MTKNDTYLTCLRQCGERTVIRWFVNFMIVPFLAFLMSCSGGVENQKTEKTERVRVRAAGYKKTDYVFTMDFSGQVKAWKTVNLSFNVSGKIDNFYFDEGNKVKKGDLLAKLEKDDSQALKDQNHAQWEKANRDYERSRRLWEEGSIREQIVQDAHTALKAAKAALDAAELNLKYCLMYVPFKGHVAYRYGEEKEMVRGGQTVFTLMDLSRVIIEIGVPEISIGRIKKGQKVSVTFEAIPRKIFSGKVFQVAVSSLPDIRLFKVEITVENPDLIIKPGMTALSTISTDKMKDVYIFSLDVTVLRNGSRVLFLASGGKAEKVTLKDCVISGDKIIIRDPLPENGQIITSGQSILFDGMEIFVIEKGNSK